MHNLQGSTLVPPQHNSPKQNSLNFVNVAKSDKDCIDDDGPGGTEPGENLVQCNVSWQLTASIFQLFSHQALCAAQELHKSEQCYRKQETVFAPEIT